MAIIGLSILFILGMYVVYPWWFYRKTEGDIETSFVADRVSPITFQRDVLRSFADNVYYMFARFRSTMGLYFQNALVVVLSIWVGCFVVYQLLLPPIGELATGSVRLFSWEHGGLFLFLMYWIGITFVLSIISMIYRDQELTTHNKLVTIKYDFINRMLVTFIPIGIAYFFLLDGCWCFLFCFHRSFLLYSLNLFLKTTGIHGILWYLFFAHHFETGFRTLEDL